MSRKRVHRRRGAVLAYGAIIMLVLTGFVGLALDWGYMSLTCDQLQTAADAAAIAGAQKILTDHTGARLAAIAFAADNKAARATVLVRDNPTNDPAGDVVLGTYDTTTNVFTPLTQAQVLGPSSPMKAQFASVFSLRPARRSARSSGGDVLLIDAVVPNAGTTGTLVGNAVKVVTRRATGSANGALPLLFGPIFGRADVNINRVAIAIAVQNSAGATAGIIALNPHADGALTLKGNGTTTVAGGAIDVDSDSSSAAVRGVGNGTIIGTQLNVDGSTSFTGNAGVGGNTQLNSNTGKPVGDPYANYFPTPATGPDLGTVNVGKTSQTVSPGYYSGGISATGKGNITFQPGVYILDGAGLQLTGQGAVSAVGVTFYIKGTGQLNINGQGSVNITPQTSGPYQGLSIWVDANDKNQNITLTGNGNMTLDGALYAPKAAMSLKGNGDVTGSQIIVDTMSLVGNGAVNVNFAGGTRPAVPPHVYLVK